MRADERVPSPMQSHLSWSAKYWYVQECEAMSICPLLSYPIYPIPSYPILFYRIQSVVLSSVSTSLPLQQDTGSVGSLGLIKIEHHPKVLPYWCWPKFSWQLRSWTKQYETQTCFQIQITWGPNPQNLAVSLCWARQILDLKNDLASLTRGAVGVMTGCRGGIL